MTVQQAGQPVQQQGVKRVRPGDDAGMAALAHHRAVAVRDGRLQLRRADRGHQHVVGGTDDLDRAADARGVAAEVGLFQGAESVQQVGFSLKVGQRQRFSALKNVSSISNHNRLKYYSTPLPRGFLE